MQLTGQPVKVERVFDVVVQVVRREILSSIRVLVGLELCWTSTCLAVLSNHDQQQESPINNAGRSDTAVKERAVNKAGMLQRGRLACLRLRLSTTMGPVMMRRKLESHLGPATAETISALAQGYMHALLRPIVEHCQTCPSWYRRLSRPVTPTPQASAR
jgi:hypothetical protein